jgi:uncharacterized UBP type Zn finger protein
MFLAEYVGLVNQAMTCYLNSLLQSLFMTPEFRNALYKWEFDGKDEEAQRKSIPFQLQRLFLKLQVEAKILKNKNEIRLLKQNNCMKNIPPNFTTPTCPLPKPSSWERLELKWSRIIF